MKNYSLIPTLSLVALTLALGTASSHAQVLLNGGFELPPIAGGAVTAVPTSWNLTSGFNQLDSNADSTYGHTDYGNQFDLLSGTISQTITGFTAGQTYVLGANFAYESGDASSFVFSVTGVANRSASFALSGPGNYRSAEIPYQSQVLVFTPTTSGAATISFSTGGARVALDNVGLYGNVPATPEAPEPTTWAALVAGLLAVCTFAGVRRLRA